jgi:hypothetical protein
MAAEDFFAALAELSGGQSEAFHFGGFPVRVHQADIKFKFRRQGLFFSISSAELIAI